jgi:hypothetical protein
MPLVDRVRLALPVEGGMSLYLVLALLVLLTLISIGGPVI